MVDIKLILVLRWISQLKLPITVEFISNIVLVILRPQFIKTII